MWLGCSDCCAPPPPVQLLARVSNRDYRCRGDDHGCFGPRIGSDPNEFCNMLIKGNLGANAIAKNAKDRCEIGCEIVRGQIGSARNWGGYLLESAIHPTPGVWQWSIFPVPGRITVPQQIGLDVAELKASSGQDVQFLIDWLYTCFTGPTGRGDFGYRFEPGVGHKNRIFNHAGRMADSIMGFAGVREFLPEEGPCIKALSRTTNVVSYFAVRLGDGRSFLNTISAERLELDIFLNLLGESDIFGNPVGPQPSTFDGEYVGDMVLIPNFLANGSPDPFNPWTVSSCTKNKFSLQEISVVYGRSDGLRLPAQTTSEPSYPIGYDGILQSVLAGDYTVETTVVPPNNKSLNATVQLTQAMQFQGTEEKPWVFIALVPDPPTSRLSVPVVNGQTSCKTWATRRINGVNTATIKANRWYDQFGQIIP